MYVAIKMGGCNGSGKTTVARAILEVIGADATQPLGKSRNNKHYFGKYGGHEVVVLGSYESTCGGMDTISDKNDRLTLIKNACKPGRIVFFEGLITGKTYGQIGALSEQQVLSGKGRWLYTFLDTPFQTCVDRVMARRAAAGNHAPMDPERTLRPTYDSVESLMLKIQQKKAAKIGPQPYAHANMTLAHKEKPDLLANLLLSRAVQLLESPK